MSMVSVVIPARNERYLQKTINDVLTKAAGEVEVIAVLDGYWPDPPVEDHPKVTLVHRSDSHGMRDAINSAVSISMVTTNSAEMFDPDTRSFTLLSAAMSDQRWSHTTVMLADGSVLVVGGRTAQNPSTPGAMVLSSADLFDPQTNSFTPTGAMKVARRSMSAVRLNDGRVLVTGGGSAVSTGESIALDSAEIYDPQTGTFKLLSSKMSVPRQYHKAIALQDGRVLIAGGAQGPGLSNSLKRVDIFDPATESFTETADRGMPASRTARTTTAVRKETGTSDLRGGVR